MDKHYIELFTKLARAVEIIAEQVMDYNHRNGDTKGEETAQIMRDDYAKLYDLLRSDDFSESSLEKADYAKFLVGALIVSQNIESHIQTEKVALNGYKIDLIPKLERIINEAETAEEIKKLTNEIFQVNT